MTGGPFEGGSFDGWAIWRSKSRVKWRRVFWRRVIWLNPLWMWSRWRRKERLRSGRLSPRSTGPITTPWSVSRISSSSSRRRRGANELSLGAEFPKFPKPIPTVLFGPHIKNGCRTTKSYVQIFFTNLNIFASFDIWRTPKIFKIRNYPAFL